MYVCVCHGITDNQIRDAVSSGNCRTIKELVKQTGCGTGCGSCLEMAADVLNQSSSRNELPLRVLNCLAA